LVGDDCDLESEEPLDVFEDEPELATGNESPRSFPLLATPTPQVRVVL
jgi:hypothetical protein